MIATERADQQGLRMLKEFKRELVTNSDLTIISYGGNNKGHISYADIDKFCYGKTLVMPLKVAIIGGGIAGLAAAIAFARYGHDVHVYERRDPSRHGESGSGILLMPNVSHILEKWDMMDEVCRVAHKVPNTELRMPNGEVILRWPWGSVQAWYGLRGVFNAMFRREALARGATIHDNTNVDQIDQMRPAIILQNGSIVEADLIIGADGSNSSVRRHLFPEYKPATLDMACFQVAMPLDQVKNDSTLCQLLSGDNTVVTLSPGRNIYACPAPVQNSYDIQFVDQEYTLAEDNHPDLHNERITDTDWLERIRARWTDHSLPYQSILQKAESAFKWRFIEVKDLPSWSRGKVVLLGDSCHSMRPMSGQGGASGIEDAALLAHLLRNSSAHDDIGELLTQYEALRRPRVERFQAFAKATGDIWACKNAEDIDQRNSVWASSKAENSKEENMQAVKPDMNAAFNSPEFQAWLYYHKVVEDSTAKL